MKVKSDFVTNSSSTAYIVFIPNNFYASDEILDEAQTMCKEDYDDYILTDEQLYKDIPDLIEGLKTGEVLSYYDYDGWGWVILIQILTNLNFIISDVCIDGEGFNLIKALKQKDILDVVINNIDLDNLVETLVKGSNNETKNKK